MISIFVNDGAGLGKEIFLPAPVDIRDTKEIQFRRNAIAIGAILFRVDR